MAFKRYTANKDNTITNSFQQNLTVRGTESNMGASDILETFYIYGQQSQSSEEKARILLEFPRNSLIFPDFPDFSWISQHFLNFS